MFFFVSAIICPDFRRSSPNLRGTFSRPMTSAPTFTSSASKPRVTKNKNGWKFGWNPGNPSSKFWNLQSNSHQQSAWVHGMFRYLYNPNNREHKTFGCSHLYRKTPTLKHWNLWFRNLHCEGGCVARLASQRQGVSEGLQFITRTNSGWLANSFWNKGQTDWWWFRNPERTHQLRLVAYLNLYEALYIPGGAGFLPSTVVSTNFMQNRWHSILPIHGFMTALVQHSVTARKIWQPGCLSFSTRPLCLSFASLNQFTYDPQIYVKDKRPHKQKWCCRNYYDTMTSGQTIVFHQPGFSLNKGMF